MDGCVCLWHQQCRGGGWGGYDGKRYKGFIYSERVYSSLLRPGWPDSYLCGINNSGALAGGGYGSIAHEITSRRGFVALATAFDADDADGDGVDDPEDRCADSAMQITVTIDACDTGFVNQIFKNGCTMQDFVDICKLNTRKRSAFVWCMINLTKDWEEKGLITLREKRAILSCAVKVK